MWPKKIVWQIVAKLVMNQIGPKSRAGISVCNDIYSRNLQHVSHGYVESLTYMFNERFAPILNLVELHCFFEV